jgi:putative protease
MTDADRHIELMAPAGSYEALAAGIRAGADSIYFGTGKLNMRAKASASLGVDDIPRIARICRWCRVKSYMTLNATLYDEDMSSMRELCDVAKAAGVSAIIASDIAVMRYCRSIDMQVHISVQANVANSESILHYAQYADTMVLARELTLKQIKALSVFVKDNDVRGPSGELVKIELFAHGALCVAVSGHCYMSLANYNSSANRGVCYHSCRRKYKVIDDETGDELVIDNEFVMSPRDLCTVQYLDLMADAGVSILKLEGRGRPADYVKTVTGVYREAVDALHAGVYTEEKKKAWRKGLETVFNRGFWDGGFYCGEKIEKWSKSEHSKATKQRVQVGVVSHYFGKPKVAEFTLWQPELKKGAELLFEGPTTGAVHAIIDEMRVDETITESALKDQIVTVKVQDKVRLKDKVFVLIPR